MVCARFVRSSIAPAHNAFTFCVYLAKKLVSVQAHPPYSPDLTRCGFFLFPNATETNAILKVMGAIKAAVTRTNRRA